MSLRSDARFVATVIVGAIRQILGETFRTLAEYLLKETQDNEPTEVHVEVPQASQRSRSKTPTQREPISREPTPDMEPKPVKPRDRTKYNPKEHGQFKVAAVNVLELLLKEQYNYRTSVPALAKILVDTCSDSTIRSACNTMVKDDILDVVFDAEAKSKVYWVKDFESAREYLASIRTVAPILPTLEESGEPQPSLN
jgi:hypothetical protein